MTEIWADMDTALELRAMDGVDDDADCGGDLSDSDEDGTSRLCGRAGTALQTICRLDCGDIHVCRLDTCKHISLNADGLYVCELSGIEYGPKSERGRMDDTGRSTWSVDPDQRSSAPGACWRRKPNMANLSESAFTAAARIDDTVQFVHPDNTEMEERAKASAVRAATKRSAICVNVDTAVDDSVAKQQRMTRRDAAARVDNVALMAEAAQTFQRLISTYKTTIQSQARCKDLPAPVADARLLDERALFTAAVRKYVKTCAARGTVPSIDDLHNLGLAVRAVVHEEQSKQRATREFVERDASQIVQDVRFQKLAANLVVALWVAACRTPYFAHARRGTDSFRPFAVGALYAFKRGVTLSNGALLVPPIPEFAAALPTARAINATDPALRALHSSSHRGLCAIHRCIASVASDQQERVFAETLQVSKQIVALTRPRC